MVRVSNKPTQPAMQSLYPELLNTVTKAVGQSKAFRDFQLKDKLSMLESDPLWVQKHNSVGVFYTICGAIMYAGNDKREKARVVRLYNAHRTLFGLGLFRHLEFQKTMAQKVFSA